MVDRKNDIEIFTHIPKGPGDFDGPEGIVYATDGNLYITSGDGWVYRISETGKVDPFAEVTGRPLGIALDLTAQLYVCESKSGAIVRVKPNGQVAIVADHAGSRKMQAPNFAVFDERGWLYISDSGSSTLEKPQPDGAIFRISPNGECELFADNLFLPNGLAMRSGEFALYVAQSTENNVLRLEIKDDYSLGEIRVFADELNSVPDGMAFTQSGDLLVVAGGTDTIYSVSAGGQLEIFAQDPPPSTAQLFAAANCAFGGVNLDEIFITNLGGFISCLTGGPQGQPLYHQQSSIHS